MKILDVTLRDGGLKNSFNWPVSYAKEHYRLASADPNINFVELGYWKQRLKYDSPYFHVDEAFLELLTNGRNSKAAVMIDYHYCPHNLDEYPLAGAPGSPALYRLTTRSGDLGRALDFAQSLRNTTGTAVSLNISNVSNIRFDNLIRTLSDLPSKFLDFIYLADSHGSFRIEDSSRELSGLLSVLRGLDVEAGIHLHNHTGYALVNYEKAKLLNFSICDVSFTGLGKGGGNLKLEEVGPPELAQHLGDLWFHHGIESAQLRDFYYFLSGSHSIVDHYADWAWESRIKPSEFAKLARMLKAGQKDVFDKDLMNAVSTRFI